MLAALNIDEDPQRIAALAIAGDTATLRTELAAAISWYRLVGSGSDLVRSIATARAILQDGPPGTGGLDGDPELLLMDCCPHPTLDGWGFCEACGSDRTGFEDDDGDQGFRVVYDVDADADGVT